jgi:hypothetical protein
MKKSTALRIGAWLLAASLTGCIVAPPPGPPPEPAYSTADTADEPPPPLPAYEQPPCPEPGYVWTPGEWQWGAEGYYWVPGTWVAPPTVGFLWTPGYWGMSGAVFLWHPGYWGPHVGFYGGINYGFGYTGTGYHGGRWVNNTFQYNTAVTNVNTTVIHNTYNQTVVNNVSIVNNTNITRVSYAGGPGTRTTPTAQEAAAAREGHVPATPPQATHQSAARTTPQFNAERNQGRPQVAGTPHPSGFTERGVTAAKPVGEAYRPQRSRIAQPRAEHEGGRP